MKKKIRWVLYLLLGICCVCLAAQIIEWVLRNLEVPTPSAAASMIRVGIFGAVFFLFMGLVHLLQQRGQLRWLERKEQSPKL